MKIIKIKKSGFFFIILTIFLGFSAINTGNNLIYLITSTLLGFMGISGFFGKQNIYNLSIDLDFPDEVFGKTEFPIKVKVSNNRKFLPAFLIKIKICDKLILFPFINVNETIEKTVKIKFYKRGINKIENIQISSTFPYNFFVRFNYFKNTFSKLVFPEPKKYSFIKEFSNNLSSFFYNTYNLEKGIDGDLIYLREYRESDSTKFIHWKLSAKKDKLIVKELSREAANSIIIDFDNFIFPDLEKKLSIITYFVIHFKSKGFNIYLKIGKELLKKRREILKTLALYNEN